MSGIFLINNNSELIELKEKQYDSENLLQELIAKYPNLLAGDLIDHDSPRRWLLITREAGIPGEEDAGDRWSVDHLFLDQDAIPTLIEVKRSTDTRIRREVAGQMLDYAANAVIYWPVEKIRSMLERRCERENINPDEQIRILTANEEASIDEYWDKVKDNLKAGNIRLIFVSDEIPTELQRIVEFLNRQMDPAEVLAIEIKQFEGQGIKTLVPRIYGQFTTKSSNTGSRETRTWSEEAILKETEEKCGPIETEIMLKIYEWAKKNNLRIAYGAGSSYGSVFPMFDYEGDTFYTFVPRTSGIASFYFKQMLKQKRFNTRNDFDELVKRLSAISGITITGDYENKYPTFNLSILKEKKDLESFLSIMDWMINEIKGL